MMFNNDRRTIMLLLIVAALILFAPIMAKWVMNENAYLSEETYYNLRIVQQFKENGYVDQDLLQERDYEFNLFHYLFAKSGFSDDWMAKYLPALFGILSLFLLYLLLKSLNLGHNDIFFALIILATTPIFLYEFTTFGPEMLALPLFLAGLICLVRGYYISAAFIGVTAFFNIFYVIIGIILIAGEYIFKRRDKLFLAVNVLVVAGAVIAGIFLLQINYAQSFIISMNGLNGFLIEFGAINGYALVTVGLALIGLFSWWSKDTKKTLILAAVMVLILFSAFAESARLPIALIISVFAGFAISYLVNREWEIYVLKDVTLLLVVCILLFSAVLTLNFQIKNITEKEVSAVAYLASVDKEDAILSSERNGFIIEYEAGRRAYLDGNSYKFDDYDQRKITADKIYYTRNLKELEEILKTERITHIFVDSDMKSGEIWNGRYEGLLFFLESSDKFIKIYYDENIQIYRYVGDEIK
ncbi:MAG: hypothetical protein ACP5N3_06145 [Candidatus Nanoarchaeia archaeon]